MKVQNSIGPLLRRVNLAEVPDAIHQRKPRIRTNISL